MLLRGHNKQTESQGEKTAGCLASLPNQDSEYHVSQLEALMSPLDNSLMKHEYKYILLL